MHKSLFRFLALSLALLFAACTAPAAIPTPEIISPQAATLTSTPTQTLIPSPTATFTSSPTPTLALPEGAVDLTEGSLGDQEVKIAVGEEGMPLSVFEGEQLYPVVGGVVEFGGQKYEWNGSTFEVKEVNILEEMAESSRNETAVFAHEELTFGMEMTPEQADEVFNIVVKGFAYAKPMQPYWAALGVSNPRNLESVKQWLKDNGNFLPGEAGGVKLTALFFKSENANAATFSTNDLLANGINLDWVRVAAYSGKGYLENPAIRSFIDELIKHNRNSDGRTPLIGGGYADTGFLITPDGRILVVSGSRKDSSNASRPDNFMGGRGGEPRDNGMEEKVATACILTYFETMAYFDQSKEGSLFLDDFFEKGKRIDEKRAITWVYGGVWNNYPVLGLYILDVEDEWLLFEHGQAQ